MGCGCVTQSTNNKSNNNIDYFNNKNNNPVIPDFINDCAGTNSTESEFVFGDSTTEVINNGNTVANIDLSNLNISLENYIKEVKYLEPNSIIKLGDLTKGLSYTSIYFLCPDFPDKNVIYQSEMKFDIKIIKNFKEEVISIDAKSNSNANPPICVIDSVNSILKSNNINVELTKTTDGNLIFKSTIEGYYFDITSVYIKNPYTNDEFIELETDFDKNIPNIKYPNGAFKGLFMMITYPVYNNSDITDDEKYILINHVPTYIPYYLQSVGLADPEGTVSNTVGVRIEYPQPLNEQQEEDFSGLDVSTNVIWNGRNQEVYDTVFEYSNLSILNLFKCFFHNSELDNCNLYGANLVNSTISNTQCFKAGTHNVDPSALYYFKDCNIIENSYVEGTLETPAYLENTKLENSTIDKVYIYNCSMGDTSTNSSSYRNILKVKNSYLYNLADYSFANGALVQNSYINAYKENEDLIPSNIPLNISNITLQDSSIYNANIKNCSMYNCYLENVNVLDSSLYMTEFVSTDLNKYNITNSYTYPNIEFNGEDVSCYTIIPKYVDINSNCTDNTTINLSQYLQYVNNNDLWITVGQMYAISALSNNPNNKEKRMLETLLICNPHNFKVKIEYIIFS